MVILMSTRWAGFGFSHYKLLKSKIAEQRATFLLLLFSLSGCHGCRKQHLCHLPRRAGKPGPAPARLTVQGVAGCEWAHAQRLEAAPRRHLQVCVPAAMGVTSDTTASLLAAMSSASQCDTSANTMADNDRKCMKCNHLAGFSSFSVIMSWFIK